jgi:hypothetical protein
MNLPSRKVMVLISNDFTSICVDHGNSLSSSYHFEGRKSVHFANKDIFCLFYYFFFASHVLDYKHILILTFDGSNKMITFIPGDKYTRVVKSSLGLD